MGHPARKLADDGKLMFGTVDTWLLYKLSQGRIHATDISNASRTMLFDITTLRWDPELLDRLGIPPSLLPEALPSSSPFGISDPDRFLGIRAKDYKECDLPEAVKIALSENDIKRAKEIAAYPWFEHNRAWQKEIAAMLDSGGGSCV